MKADIQQQIFFLRGKHFDKFSEVALGYPVILSPLRELRLLFLMNMRFRYIHVPRVHTEFRLYENLKAVQHIYSMQAIPAYTSQKQKKNKSSSYLVAGMCCELGHRFLQVTIYISLHLKCQFLLSI